MLRDIRKNKIFNRRTFLISGGQSVLTFALVTRLSYLQLWKHGEYSVQSDSNSIKPIINPAPRGVILDRKGVALAVNENNYRLFLYLENKRNSEELATKLTEILDFDEDAKKNVLNKIKNARRKTIISLMDNLSWDDVARLEANSYRLPGLSIESGIQRRYPFPYETAHFLGYVSLPSEDEINKNEPNLFLHPDFRIGKSGIERSFDDALRGKYGVKYVEVNAFETPLRTLSVKQSEEGSRLHLTIDIFLQKFVAERIKNEVASVVVMDVKTGEILAYASSPSFDPNNFVEGIPYQLWKDLNEDPRRPLNNKPIAALYPPGSTFKLMVALAALEAGINPHNHVFCNGSYQSGRRAFHCWKEGGHGSVDLMEGIMQSCNVMFFTLANQIGIGKISEMAKRFGYGEKFDISLYGAKAGNVPSEEWKQKIYKQPWTGGDTLNTAIGQGFTLATPLQMALITARLANGGVPIKPYLVRNHNIYRQYDDLKNNLLVKNDDHLKFVLEGMRRVVNDPRGTSYYRRIVEKGYEMAGKTGTSQVVSKREKEMTKAESALNTNQNHAIFVGFAPTDSPKYAISVVVEHGKSGSGAAAPIAHDVLLEAQMLIKRSRFF